MNITNLTAILVIGMFIFIFYSLGRSPWNTETVCFYPSGKIAFYAKGYHPSSTPLIALSQGVYLVKETREKIYVASCKGSWGVVAPKGREYYE